MKTIPHYYQYIQGWFTQERFYSRMVYSCNEDRPYHFVEIGSWKGRSSCYMGVEILNSQKIYNLIALILGLVQKNILIKILHIMRNY